MQPSNPLIISSGVASLSRKFLPCAPTRRTERGDGSLVRVWPGACVLHLRLAHLSQRGLARSRLFRRAQTCGATDFWWAITAEHYPRRCTLDLSRSRSYTRRCQERSNFGEAAQLDEARMLLHVGTLGLALLTPSRRLSPVASQLSQRTCSPQMIGSMDRLLDTFRSPDPSELPGVCTHCYPLVAARPQALTCATGPIVP